MTMDFECSYQGDCQLTPCTNSSDCFIKQLFMERDAAEAKIQEAVAYANAKIQDMSLLTQTHTKLLDKLTESDTENKRLQMQLEDIKDLLTLSHKEIQELRKHGGS